ncbi:TadE/TadG family type IV pilus assembly protein [Brevirhabdus sp.]|uniref:TadE/TadG family type IV pilus assembly protein n=1 Tax=Brevirhabdus sp. TaxID=2004514 RepID=UPI00405954A4
MPKSRKFSGFLASESGVLTTEFVLIVPFLVSAYVLAYAYFDAFQTKNSSQKAAYTISDLMSRETVAVNAGYVEGIKKIFDYLSRSNPEDSWIRVSSITYNKTDDVYKVQWSYVTAELQPTLTNDELSKLLDRIPVMSDGDTFLLTETSQAYTPVFNWMFKPTTFTHFIPTSPRFAPQLAWNNN